jgi:hypothetical protein
LSDTIIVSRTFFLKLIKLDNDEVTSFLPHQIFQLTHFDSINFSIDPF